MFMRMMTLFSVALLMACTTTPTPANAGTPNLLVMGEDGDKDTIPRKSRVFRRVLDMLNEEMNAEGFDVFDETVLTMDTSAQGRSRRSDPELFDIARSVTNPPIDVVVTFQIYASATRLDYTTKIRTRVAGRMLNVRSGQRLGNFEVVSPKHWRGPPNCNRECIIELVGDKAKILAQDLAGVLTTKLAHLVTAGGGGDGSGGGMQMVYNLVFDGFNGDEVSQIEEYLTMFSGYSQHDIGEAMGRRIAISYKSTIGSSKLRRNLQRMLNEMNSKGRITYEGNTYKVQKIKLRKARPGLSKDGW